MSKTALSTKNTLNNARGFIPRESTNQFAVLEKTFFPGRFDETGKRKPATPPKEKKIDQPEAASVESN